MIFGQIATFHLLRLAFGGKLARTWGRVVRDARESSRRRAQCRRGRQRGQGRGWDIPKHRRSDLGDINFVKNHSSWREQLFQWYPGFPWRRISPEIRLRSPMCTTPLYLLTRKFWCLILKGDSPEGGYSGPKAGGKMYVTRNIFHLKIGYCTTKNGPREPQTLSRGSGRCLGPIRGGGADPSIDALPWDGMISLLFLRLKKAFRPFGESPFNIPTGCGYARIQKLW